MISGVEKVWIRGGGSIKIFRRCFLSHSAGNFRRGVLYCCNNFAYRKSSDKRGGSNKVFRRNLFVLQCRKFSSGNPLVFHCSRVSKNFMTIRGISVFSMENFLSHSAENFRRGTLLSRVLEKFQ